MNKKITEYQISVPKIAFAQACPIGLNELDFFRKQLEPHQPYTARKKGVFLYKTIFITLGFLFALLGFASFSLTSTIAFGIFHINTTLKGLVLLLCTMFSLASILMGLSISPCREAAIQSLQNGRRTLHTLYARKKIQCGVHLFSSLGHNRHHANALHLMYKDTWAKMSSKKEESLHLITRIWNSPSLEKERKELLLNQAIIELEENLSRLNHQFKHSNPSLG